MKFETLISGPMLSGGRNRGTLPISVRSVPVCAGLSEQQVYSRGGQDRPLSFVSFLKTHEHRRSLPGLCGNFRTYTYYFDCFKP